MKRFSKWLRCLGWLGFAALFLGTCVVVVRWLVLDRGHAKVQELANRHRARVKPIPDAAGQSAVADPAPQSLDATPVRELPFVGMGFSEDPALLEEFAKVLEELDKISLALARTPEGGRLVHRIGHFINFKSTLENLGIRVPDGMTEAEAAAEFLRHMEKMSRTLARLRAALEKGPWDWGKWDGWGLSESNERRHRLNQLLQRAGAATTGLMQAQWRTGNTSEGWSHWEMLRLLAFRAGEDATSYGAAIEASLQARAARAVSIGIAFDGWTDDQLARFPPALASDNAFAVSRRGIEADLNYLDELSIHPADLRAFFGNRPMPPSGVGSIIRHLSANLMSDQHIQDNLAIIAADYEHALAQLDVQNRLFIIPAAGARSPSVEIVNDRSFFTDFYFMPFKDLVAWDEKRASFAAGQPRSAVHSQAGTDHARLAAALEIQRRATGQYPASIEEVGGAFPGGMPHDVATGQPYFYERTPDGAYKLWGTGIDQINNNGDPKKDILFTLPKLPTP